MSSVRSRYSVIHAVRRRILRPPYPRWWSGERAEPTGVCFINSVSFPPARRATLRHESGNVGWLRTSTWAGWLGAASVVLIFDICNLSRSRVLIFSSLLCTPTLFGFMRLRKKKPKNLGGRRLIVPEMIGNRNHSHKQHWLDLAKTIIKQVKGTYRHPSHPARLAPVLFGVGVNSMASTRERRFFS